MRTPSTALLLLNLVFCPFALSQEVDFESLPGVRPIGNTLIRNDSIENVVRGMIARALNGDTEGSALSIETSAYQQTIDLPDPKPGLKEILDILGIRDRLDIAIHPVQARLLLPASALKIKVVKKAENRFEVIAGWKITELSARTENLSIRVPEGIFPRAFLINSSPIVIGLKADSQPIRLELKILLDLTNEGTRIKITGYRTNLKDRIAPEFFLKLGRLTVDREPLELEIRSNGGSLIAREEVIRREFQEMEPMIMKTLRERLVKAIHENMIQLAGTIEAQPPFRLTLVSDDLLRTSTLDPKIKSYLTGIQTDLMINSLQFFEQSRLFSARIAARFCFDGSCLTSASPTSPVGVEDLLSMDSEDHAGVVFYESVVQDLVHSEAVQTRIRRWYNESGTSPGVSLSPTGVKVRLNPAQNAISAILNLDIDIIKTVRSNSSFGERISRELGDLIERIFGSGKSVKIPVEVKFFIEAITRDANGGSILTLRPVLPFTASGEYLPPENCPPGWCPSNVPSMTAVVKKSFMKSVRKEFETLLPKRITIPTNQDISLRDLTLRVRNVRVSQNHGLLISGTLRDVGEEYQ